MPSSSSDASLEDDERLEEANRTLEPGRRTDHRSGDEKLRSRGSDEQLRDAQQQPITREKIASLGGFVAGVAHEVNTPIGAINSSADFANRCIEKIEGVISQSTAADELRNRVEVVKKYGDLPMIDFFPNKLNQVFTNLLINASQTIEGSGTILLSAELAGDTIVIRIADSGKGTSPENLEKVFNPGFIQRKSARAPASVLPSATPSSRTTEGVSLRRVSPAGGPHSPSGCPSKGKRRGANRCLFSNPAQLGGGPGLYS